MIELWMFAGKFVVSYRGYSKRDDNTHRYANQSNVMKLNHFHANFKLVNIIVRKTRLFIVLN